MHRVGPSYLSLTVLLPCTSLLPPLPVCALRPPSWPCAPSRCRLPVPLPPHPTPPSPSPPGPFGCCLDPPLPFPHCLGPSDPLSSHSLAVSISDPLFCLLSLTCVLWTSRTSLGPPPFLAPVLWTPHTPPSSHLSLPLPTARPRTTLGSHLPPSLALSLPQTPFSASFPSPACPGPLGPPSDPLLALCANLLPFAPSWHPSLPPSLSLTTVHPWTTLGPPTLPCPPHSDPPLDHVCQPATLCSI